MKRNGSCGCQEAGFFDSGPYAPLAAQRWDQLGPGVYEAGAIADGQARGQIGGLRLLVPIDLTKRFNWPDGRHLVKLLGGSGRGARILVDFRGGNMGDIAYPLATAFPERGTGYKIGDRLRVATWYGPEFLVTNVYDGTNQPQEWFERGDPPIPGERVRPVTWATAEADQSGGALVLVALAGLAWILTAKP